MKKLKDIFENYSEQPSGDVWKRLNERLDTEMPVQAETSRNATTKALGKWVAAGVAAVVLAGGVALFSLTYRIGDKPKPAGMTETVVPPETAETVAAEVAAPSEAAAEQPVAEAKVAKEKVTETALTVENARPSANQPEPGETVVAKTNVKQVVRPANSTLARQLAEDPVLKTLSPDAVDWSLPTRLSIPNLFTPNNDGTNDLFVIEGLENYSSPKLVVRDKNNHVVYQSNNYKNTWGGENCPDGVYNYEFTFEYNHIESQAIGKVRIMRSSN